MRSLRGTARIRGVPCGGSVATIGVSRGLLNMNNSLPNRTFIHRPCAVGGNVGRDCDFIVRPIFTRGGRGWLGVARQLVGEIFTGVNFSITITLIILGFVGIGTTLTTLITSNITFVISITIPGVEDNGTVSLYLLNIYFTYTLFTSFCCNACLPRAGLFNGATSIETCVISLPRGASSNGCLCAIGARDVDNDSIPRGVGFRVCSRDPICTRTCCILSVHISFSSITSGTCSSVNEFSSGVFIHNCLSSYTGANRIIGDTGGPIIRLHTGLGGQFGSIVGGSRNKLTFTILANSGSLLNGRTCATFHLYNTARLVTISNLRVSVLFNILCSLLGGLLIPGIPQISIYTINVLFCVVLSNFSGSVVEYNVVVLIFLLKGLIGGGGSSLGSLNFTTFVIYLGPCTITSTNTRLAFATILKLVAITPRVRGGVGVGGGIFSCFTNVLYTSLTMATAALPSVCFLFNFISFTNVTSGLLLVPLTAILLILSTLFTVLSSIPTFT